MEMRAGHPQLRSVYLLRNAFPEAHDGPRRRSRQPKMKTQIIGCGNLHRMDDGAGVLVARRLRELGIPAEIQSGGAFELIGGWERDEHLILIDAVMTGAPTGTVHVWQGSPPHLPHATRLSSHGFGLAEAFRLGQILNCLPQRITVYGIEGDRFGMGEQASAEVVAASERVAQQIANEFAQESQEEAVQFVG
jgi:hydrogenase maturation protease